VCQCQDQCAFVLEQSGSADGRISSVSRKENGWKDDSRKWENDEKADSIGRWIIELVCLCDLLCLTIKCLSHCRRAFQPALQFTWVNQINSGKMLYSSLLFFVRLRAITPPFGTAQKGPARSTAANKSSLSKYCTGYILGCRREPKDGRNSII
jgi:hypothetical protein